MANSLITPSIIAKEALFQLENNVIMGDCVHREYKREFVKIGDTVTIRKPVKFKATDGAARSNQDVLENTTSITINNRKHVSWTFSTQDLTLTVEEYSERYIKPAMIVLANAVDEALCLEGAQKFHQIVGTPGTTPSSYTDLAAVAQRMDEVPVPDDGYRKLVLNPASRWAMATGIAGTGTGGTFNPGITGPMIRKGSLGELANFQVYGDQNIVTRATGAYNGTPLINGTTLNGASALNVDGGTGSVTGWLLVGDIITIDGVFAVNDVSKEPLPYLKQFVVTQNVNTSAGATIINVFPALDDGSTASTAAYQNVSALPADNAPVNVLTGTASQSYPQNLAFHRNALALVTVPLELPDSVVFKARADWRGFSIRVIKAYDIDADEEVIRLDIFFGVKAIYEELGVRLVG